MLQEDEPESFQNLGIDDVYSGSGREILVDFLLPLLDNAVSYDRITSFYTLDSLIAISSGVERLYIRGGKMRLILGIHSIPPELIEASAPEEAIRREVERIGREIEEGILKLSDALHRKRLATLAWMIEDGLLEVKAAAMIGGGIFHTKTFLLSDELGNVIVAVGSSNETRSGLGDNHESIMVQKSWSLPHAVEKWCDIFSRLWEGRTEGVCVCAITDEVAATINRGFDGRPPVSADCAHRGYPGVIAAARRMPSFFFVSGSIPGLYQHQERAVLDALSRWPVRVLLSDEVGLGKTFEAAAAMSFLVKYCGVKKVVILTPKSVLAQWQSELYSHFGITAWLYDSSRKIYTDPNGTVRPQRTSNPLGKGHPDIVLISVQYARGYRDKLGCLERPDAELPELLVVDEAHAARVSKQLGGGEKRTRLYSMLECVCKKIPHMIFATATPMQKDVSEYHALLSLLGLPKRWRKAKRFSDSLDVIGSSACPDLTAAMESAKLLLSTLDEMNPNLSVLDSGSLRAVRGLEGLDRNDSYSIADYVQKNWDELREAFVVLHPAHLLTVRNTRRSLEGIGYQFPKRNLHAVTIEGQQEVLAFYGRIDAYLSNEYFAVERELYPNRKNSIGFTRVGYQQRISSSIWSCFSSLKKRLEKLDTVEKVFSTGDSGEDTFISQLGLDIDPEDDIDLFDDEDASTSVLPLKFNAANKEGILAAATIEASVVRPLLEEARNLLSRGLDMKVKRSVDIAMEQLVSGDKVLLFSRYTDTVDALVSEFERRKGATSYEYGVYRGGISFIVRDGIRFSCTKTEITDELRLGGLRLLVCSDAASEGINLQAARVLINVDVPWTPSILEQRIGRVARLGQKAPEVDIYNVWYPKSVEQRMYTRIQERFQTINLAVGEFPDVIAADIRDAILAGSPTTDSGIESLLEFRNSVQTKALERLFTERAGHKTASESIRSALMDAAMSTFEYNDMGGGDKEFILSDGSRVILTTEVGCDQTISLDSKLWSEKDFPCSEVVVVDGPNGSPAAFASTGGGSHLLDNTVLIDILKGNSVQTKAFDDKRPETLPEPAALSMAFACEECPPRPEFWTWKGGDDNS